MTRAYDKLAPIIFITLTKRPSAFNSIAFMNISFPSGSYKRLNWHYRSLSFVKRRKKKYDVHKVSGIDVVSFRKCISLCLNISLYLCVSLSLFLLHFFFIRHSFFVIPLKNCCWNISTNFILCIKLFIYFKISFYLYFIFSLFFFVSFYSF